ncbi:alpha/beta hydrolase family protein [Bacillus paralicheniformis]|uniref:alpha/beta hydrolase family protein n=1 Tax=Bacillus paralicheniformis TaxID=1648923 RepID=UPI000D0472D1|nr:alpha/beta hydrolase [Bacillus paralicheniformis]
MAYEVIFKDDVNFNFQVNRLLAYGEAACQKQEVYEATKKMHNFETWYEEWHKLAQKAELESRFLHSMYYYRMAEFMLKDDDPRKDEMYYKMTDMFSKAFPKMKRHKIPFRDGYLPCLYLKAEDAKNTILIHGGYDSFIEEFYLICEEFVQAGYSIILFEGEGQGGTLRQGMKFNEKWERSVSVILNFFELTEAALIGISWGGYFALRAAAFDKRIPRVVCFDVCYDGLDVQFRLMKQPVRAIFTLLYKLKCKRAINVLVRKKMRRDRLADWAISHGMYITRTDSPYEFYQAIEKHTLQGLLNKIDQQVLLLAGEKDHYIPRWQFKFLKNNLPNAHVTARLFTEAEDGEQHCRVGNYDLAIQFILSWLKENGEHM